jgi:hypothetical protein
MPLASLAARIIWRLSSHNQFFFFLTRSTLIIVRNGCAVKREDNVTMLISVQYRDIYTATKRKTTKGTALPPIPQEKIIPAQYVYANVICLMAPAQALHAPGIGPGSERNTPTAMCGRH